MGAEVEGTTGATPDRGSGSDDDADRGEALALSPSPSPLLPPPTATRAAEADDETVEGSTEITEAGVEEEEAPSTLPDVASNEENGDASATADAAVPAPSASALNVPRGDRTRERRREGCLR